ncbi:hypothetical protein Dimus_029747 [Dionaea muscipula]
MDTSRNVQSVARKLAQKRKHPTDIFEGVHERQQLTIGRRSSPRKKQVHGPQNPLDDEAHAEQHRIEVEGVYERQQLTIGRRSSPRKKQVHGPQNPLDGEAHTEEAAEIAERRVHERGRSQYHNQNQLIGELLQEDQTLEGRQSKEHMTRELHQDEEIEFTEEQSVELDPTVQEVRSTDDREKGPEPTSKSFKEFVGTLSRMSNLCPLNVEKWTDMDKVYKGTKEKIWPDVKKRYLISDRAKKWVLQTVGADWRGFKGRLKRDHYKPYKTNKMRWNKRPDYVPSEHFRWLLKRWNDSKDQACVELPP